jgi:hypothetical protein
MLLDLELRRALMRDQAERLRRSAEAVRSAATAGYAEELRRPQARRSDPGGRPILPRCELDSPSSIG